MNRSSVAGTLAGIGVVAGVIAAHRWFERGPGSFRTEFARIAEQQLAETIEQSLVTEDDLRALPSPVAKYIRATGAVGRPRIGNFRATIRGRIRSGPDQPWMTFTGEQVNGYGPESSRLFRIVASMRGAPTDVYHQFVGADATMRVRVWSMFPIVSAKGPEMNRSETVTIFNDMCVFAPAVLVDAAVEWEKIDERTVRGTFTRLDETVAATLVFDDDGLLVDFISDDRFRSSSNGSTFERQRWSTPVSRYRPMNGRLVCTHGEGRWHSGSPESSFAYVEFDLDDIEFNTTPAT
jgi:hypothetical protein